MCKMLLIILMLSNFFVYSDASTAVSCKTTFNLPEFLKEPRDQADIGWCYAYAGADLVSAYAGKQVSAADIAVNHNFGKVNKSFVQIDRDKPKLPREELDQSGKFGAAIQERSMNEGFCLEKDFPSSVVQKAIDNPKKNMTEVVKIPVSTRLYQALRLGRLNFTPNDCDKTGAAQAFPNIQVQRLSQILFAFDDRDGDTNRSMRLAYLAGENCNKRRFSAGFAAKDVLNSTLSVELMNKALDEGKIAVVGMPLIPYIKTPTPEEFEKFKDDREALEKSGGGHAMLLVGRKWDSATSSCQFIFKNSWGKSTDKTQNTIDGYTIISEGELSKLKTGDFTTIEKSPTWKRGGMPEFLKN